MPVDPKTRTAPGSTPTGPEPHDEAARATSSESGPQLLADSALDAIAARVSGTLGGRVPGGNLLPGTERDLPGGFSKGALGRLDRARLGVPGRRGANVTTFSSPRRASTASRPAACSPTWTASSLQVRKFEGNPEHPGSRGRNCAKGPATLNQVTDPDRILYPLRRSGPRGGGSWERISWDEALDALAGRIRTAIAEGRQNEIMVHLGRPGEDGFTERVLASWGVDGHNSHTNVCSSAGRTGYQFWTGSDRPSPDYANARVIYLISAHLEAGHYFNPHAQRITEARASGAKLIVLDTRALEHRQPGGHWLSPVPGSEAAINLSIARHLIATGRYDSEFVRRWWNWAEYLKGMPSRAAGQLCRLRRGAGRPV